MTDNCDTESDGSCPFPQGRFDGPAEFQQWIRLALHCAAEQGLRELILCDRDFRDWPLGEREVLEALNAWASAGGPSSGRSPRKCIVLAGSFEFLRARHPRFVQWRTRWDHLIECRLLGTRNASDIPSAIWAPGWCLQRLDVERSRGTATIDARHGLVLHEHLREWIASRSRPGFPATILGL
ncbi:MAG: hypothetical protein LBE61_16500 [Burkholderiaceae bacterium]|jgi:hypothetical protein|nr:hypothetical protein [Burkholderiaceae bacterium]